MTTETSNKLAPDTGPLGLLGRVVIAPVDGAFYLEVNMVEKKCTKCGGTKRLPEFVTETRRSDGHGPHCLECERKYKARHRDATRDQEHERRKVQRATFQEKTKARDLAYRISHREHLREYAREYRENNRERCRNLGNKWAHLNPEKASDSRKKSFAKRRGAGVRTEKISSVEIYNRDRWICQLCKKKVSRKLAFPDPMSPSLDHIVPVARGGAHEKKNVHLAHLVCNMRAQVGGVKQLRLIG